MLEPNVTGTELGSGKRKKPIFVFLFFAVLFFVFFLVFLPSYLNRPTNNFPLNTEIVVSQGLSHTQIAETLKTQNAIRSVTLFNWYLKRNHEGDFIKAGTYVFNNSMTTSEVAAALVKGDYEITSIRITFPEGFNTNDLLMYLPNDMTYETSNNIESLEGYLFPDTYFITENMTLDDIIELMTENFKTKMSELDQEIASSHLTLEEIITLASLIEREAGDLESKKIVSGILQNRLEIGMALQVDAVFDFLLGKESSELTEEDLMIDSPYNTYLYPGLPKGPIANPGLDSIRAVFEPTETDYLYYLTAPDGTFYYSRTFEEHKMNKFRYLR